MRDVNVFPRGLLTAIGMQIGAEALSADPHDETPERLDAKEQRVEDLRRWAETIEDASMRAAYRFVLNDIAESHERERLWMAFIAHAKTIELPPLPPELAPEER
jgi:transcription elongation GreA/GreB family factor